MKVYLDSTEWYPVYVATGEPRFEGQVSHEIEADVLARWQATSVEFDKVQGEMRDIIDPPCPECKHRRSRHQEWSAGWDRWGCLATGCQCQHGIPEDRKKR